MSQVSAPFWSKLRRVGVASFSRTRKNPKGTYFTQDKNIVRCEHPISPILVHPSPGPRCGESIQPIYFMEFINFMSTTNVQDKSVPVSQKLSRDFRSD